MRGKFFIAFVFLCSFAFANQPFEYDLHLTYTPCQDSSEVMILAHGMGGNYKIADSVKAKKTLVSFNFPDYDYCQRVVEVENSSYGTINELLPLVYVIKKCVIIDGYQKIDLYGFSAGGGAIINALSALNTTRFDKELKKIEVFQEEKEKMLAAIQKGLIILDTPLKSIREIIDFRGSSKEFEVFAKRYRENDMEPIDSLKYLKGLSLHVLLHFQNPDEILSNRDDELFFDRLKRVNSNGTTTLFVGRDNGHCIPHASLWDYYSKENLSNAERQKIDKEKR